MRARSWTVVAGVAAGALAFGGRAIDVEGHEVLEEGQRGAQTPVAASDGLNA